jgi:hypothetical protein
MRPVILPYAVANSSSLCDGSALIRSLRLFVLITLFLFAMLPSMTAQSEDRTITALKRGESTYFTAKMQNLSEQLRLNQSQQTRLRPIAEQETAYIEQIRMNPVLSAQEKFKRLQEIVRDSDKKMKQFLSAQQWQKLQSLRKDQKATLENYVKTR